MQVDNLLALTVQFKTLATSSMPVAADCRLAAGCRLRPAAPTARRRPAQSKTLVT